MTPFSISHICPGSKVKADSTDLLHTTKTFNVQYVLAVTIIKVTALLRVHLLDCNNRQFKYPSMFVEPIIDTIYREWCLLSKVPCSIPSFYRCKSSLNFIPSLLVILKICWFLLTSQVTLLNQSQSINNYKQLLVKITHKPRRSQKLM